MELSADQKTAVGAWVRQGAGLFEIQTRLRAEFGLSATYMDVRFLVLDLGLAIKDKARPPENRQKDKLAAAPDREADADTAGGVAVEIDRVMKPGALVSGSVTFSDGVSATWLLDQLGRLALQAQRPGYRPSAEDMAAFQTELRTALEKQGY
ncbi:MAG: hypothetical protein FJ225_01230 [Lentisphaerae bacterium]|nr:hypothetical protein [Lentisphaerota bacterium]